MKCTAILSSDDVANLIARAFANPEDLKIVFRDKETGEPKDVSIECTWERGIYDY